MKPRTTVAASLVAAALLLTSCGGGGGSDSDKKPAKTTTTMPGGIPTTAPPKAVATNKITIDQYAFTPSVIKVKVGTKVTITNDDAVAHTFTSDDGSFDTGEIAPGDSATITVAKPKVKGATSVGFHCKIHLSMIGSIVFAT